jgi:exopolysaccharide production protein ExoZ
MRPILKFLADQFELARGGQAQNIRPMEGLRGFAVFLVFLVHYASLSGPMIAWVSWLRQGVEAVHIIGNVGVDLFFVLSGYLIYGTLISKPRNFFSFMKRRVWRIYPVFLVVFAIYFVLSFVFPSESKIPNSLTGGAIYLLQNLLLLPGVFSIPPMIFVAWSLSYEFSIIC